MQPHSISQNPTFDLTQFEVIDHRENVLFCRTLQVFYFDGVYGFIRVRSRAVRHSKPEGNIINSLPTAVIDAGFCGQLEFKIVLNPSSSSKSEYSLELLQNCLAIMLIPSPAGNYYDGSNQTNTSADLTFTL